MSGLLLLTSGAAQFGLVFEVAGAEICAFPAVKAPTLLQFRRLNNKLVKIDDVEVMYLVYIIPIGKSKKVKLYEVCCLRVYSVVDPRSRAMRASIAPVESSVELRTAMNDMGSFTVVRPILRGTHG